MVGSTGTLMTMRLVRSKLRKREETSSASPATNIEAQTTTFATTPANNHHHHNHHQNNNNNNNHRNSTSSQCSNSSSQNQQMVSTSSSTTSFEANHNQNNANMNNNNLQSTINSNGNCNLNGNGTTVTFVRQNNPAANSWVFPPKAPTPNIYNCSNNFDAIANANDRHGFKGFRKQFSGRFKRLIVKKPAEPAPAIPPELKPQLKTIFVY